MEPQCLTVAEDFGHADQVGTPHHQTVQAERFLQASGNCLNRVALVRLDRDARWLVDHADVGIKVDHSGSPVCCLRCWVALWIGVHPYPLSLLGKTQLNLTSEASFGKSSKMANKEHF